MIGSGVEFQTYVMMRVTRWAIFCMWQADLLTKRPGPAPVRSWLGVIMAQRVRHVRESAPRMRSRCPVDEVECGITDLCIKQLPVPLREVIVASNLYPGTAEEKALELGCSRRTYFRRLQHAQAELLGLFNDHEAGVLRAECENPVTREPPVSGPVTGKRLKPASTRGISRALILDKSGTVG